VKRTGAAILAASLAVSVAAAANETLYPDSCDDTKLNVQVLGSGGADPTDGRAASSYLVWIDGKARVLIDAGAGAALRFAEAGARAADIDALLLTQLNVTHALDVPALIAAAVEEQRARVLPLYGPTGNRFAPSTVTFTRALFDGTRGAYRQLSDVLSPLAKDSFKLRPHDVRTRVPTVGVRRNEKEIVEVLATDRFRAAATYAADGGAPLLAWRVQVGGRSIIVAGATVQGSHHLEDLAHGADLLIVDDVVEPDRAAEAIAIGRIAAQTQAKRLVVSRRTVTAPGAADTTLGAIRRHYAGPVAFADDLDCFVLP
jgi:ribonuclease BN (tRNA processing enzyme)